MENEIYKSPDADLELPASENGSVLKGVSWGALVDIGGSFFLSIVMSMIYGAILLSGGFGEQEVIKALSEISLYSPISLLGTCFGLLISFCAGYLCAKKSGKKIVVSTIILCFISSSFGLAFGFGFYSLVENAALTILTMLSISLGARTWAVKRPS